MALLNDLDETEPTLSRDPREGDNHIRQVKDKVKAWADVEHDKGTGWHKIYTNAATPTPAIVGHLWLRSTDSELFAYISGGVYTKLTSKAEVTQAQADITALEAADVALGVRIDAVEVDIANIEGDILNISNAQSLFSYTPGSYNLDVPANVYKMIVKIWGASGGGGGGGDGGGNDCGELPGMPGGGGGGGGYCEAIVTVTPGETIPITVGGKGVGGERAIHGTHDNGNNGTAGGNCSFGGYITVTGGGYGSGGSDYDTGHTGGTLGGGGAVTITSGTGIVAGNGSDGTSATWNGDYTLVVSGNGGAASTSYYSQVAAQAGDSSTGCAANIAGGTSGGKGGGGGGGASGTGNGLSGAGDGGDGSDGFMIVSW